MAAVAAAAATQAAELQVLDNEQQFSRFSLMVKAESVVHHRENYLLLRIQPYGMRTVGKADGSREAVWLKDRGLSFLPVTVWCDRVILESGGKRHKPDGFSPCKGSVQFETAESPPVFVAFKYPAKGGTKLTVPVTVSPPSRPVEERLVRGPSPPARFSGQELVGEQALSISVLVPDAPAR